MVKSHNIFDAFSPTAMARACGCSDDCTDTAPDGTAGRLRFARPVLTLFGLVVGLVLLARSGWRWCWPVGIRSSPTSSGPAGGAASPGGEQFEYICKWFLTNDPVYKREFRHVWLWDEWPGRWAAEAGIDLVTEDRQGAPGVSDASVGRARVGDP